MPYNPWSKGLTKETDPRLARMAQMKVKPKPSYDELFELYHEQGLTAREIGQRFDLSKTTIQELLHQYDIRPKREDLTSSVLQELYIEQGMTTVEIANIYNCSCVHVQNLLAQYGIPKRHRRNRAGIKPDPTELYHLYWEEWLGYQEIANRYGIDMTTIPYWLRKFDIPLRSNWKTRRGKDWDPIPEKEVVRLYRDESYSAHAIGQMFGVTKGPVLRILKEHGIELRPNGYPSLIQHQASDGHVVRSSLELQVDEWLIEHDLAHEYEPNLPDSYFKADFKVQDVYVEIWGIKGSQRYTQSKQVKLDYYEQHGLCVISILPADFPELRPLQALLKDAL